MLSQIQFTIPEILSLIGVTQCVYLLVYMAMRSGWSARAILPIVYFGTLCCAFLLDFANAMLSDLIPFYFYFQWAAWFMGPPLSVLLIKQIVDLTQTPALKEYRVLLLIPAAFAVSIFASSFDNQCDFLKPCEEIKKWLVVTGLMAGALSLLSVWSHRDLLDISGDRKTGKDRYWLVLSIICANIAFLFMMLLSLGAGGDPVQIVLTRTVIGLGIVYLVGTSLFRIYPQALVFAPQAKYDALTDEDRRLAAKIEKLMREQKVYQEAEYARSDLARECGVSESVVSKIINLHFGKSFPQIISEFRVQDAKILLGDTDANIKTIAEEVGFNSVATFNRVFRDITKETPTEYRKRAKT
jgi:AraC-like DNA-binding protein